MRTLTTETFAKFFTVLGIIFVLVYSFGRLKNFLIGPTILITAPPEDSVPKNDSIVIDGEVQNASKITLNDREIFVDEGNHFSEPFLLHYGYNIVELAATDRFGKTVRRTLQFIYQ